MPSFPPHASEFRVPVYILAGGRSSRFGGDKARALVGGRPLILCVGDALAPAAASLTVVARDADAYADLGLRTIADPTPDLGPIGGLAAALGDVAPETWLLLAACDWTGLRAEWVARLLEAMNPIARCVLFRDRGLQPLLALYHSSIRASVEQAIAEGRLAMHDLVESLPRKELPPPPDWASAINVNTLDQLPPTGGRGKD